MQWLTRLIQFVFPPACLLCHKEGKRICDVCFSLLPRVPLREQKLLRLTGFYSACPYRHADIKKILYALKFGHKALWNDAAPLLRPALLHLTRRCPDVLITFVPLSPARKRQRGYDQAQLLAESTGFPIARLLYRTRNTHPQAKLNRKSRMVNMLDAFALLPDVDVMGRVIIVIDDVATTGATLSACADALRSGGTVAVYGVTIAHG